MKIDLPKLRKQLHRIPEIAFAEANTKLVLLSYLHMLEGIRIHEFTMSNGILVDYKGCEGNYRLFRADMDALPVQENTGCDFASQNPGMMHACGHDIHMTVLLGLIQRICELKPKVNLLFLFQPAEEGKGGAESILSENLIQSYPVSEVFALHVASDMPVGAVSSKPGVFFGIPQEFDVVFKGVSAHAAFPEKGVNALQAGVRFMQLMQADIAELGKTARVIFHVGKMTSGTVRNVVSDRCVLEGTHRTLSKNVRDTINKLILSNCAAVSEELHAEYEVDFLCSYDPVINAQKLVTELEAVCNAAGIKYLEAETALTGEDFGFFTTLYPGLLFWLGSGCNYPLHSDKFLADESCIEMGIKVMELLALQSSAQ